MVSSVEEFALIGYEGRIPQSSDGKGWEGKQWCTLSWFGWINSLSNLHINMGPMMLEFGPKEI